MDRIIKKDNLIIVSQDRTRYTNTDTTILNKWYPKAYKTMALIDITDEDGYINYVFDATNFKDFNVDEFNTLDKLRCAYGLFQYEVAFENNYHVSLEDDNVYLDSGNNIEVLYVEDSSIYDVTGDKVNFLNSIKARILSMFSKYSFEEIMKSNFTLNFSSKFEKEILETHDVNELKELLARYIEKQEKEQKVNYVFVKRKGFVRYRFLTYAFLLLFLVVSIFSFYSYQTYTKSLKFENELYNEFINRNYSEVLKLTKGEELSSEQKYLVGYAGIMTSSLDGQKKDIILSTYSKNVSDSVKEYWIYIGYGEYNMAINEGKSVNNDEYVLYALRLEENRLLSDEKMDGSEKESQLKVIQDSISTYEDKLGITEDGDSNNE